MDRYVELRELVDAMEKRHAELLEEGESLIAEVARVAYADTKISLVLVLRWKSCSRSDCAWCPSGHGPYWRYSRYLGKTQKTISRDLKGITHREMLRVLGHTKGYKVLKPLDDRRKLLVKKLKAIKDGTVRVRKIIRTSIKDDSIW